jgi:hypothetical protein
MTRIQYKELKLKETAKDEAIHRHNKLRGTTYNKLAKLEKELNGEENNDKEKEIHNGKDIITTDLQDDKQIDMKLNFVNKIRSKVLNENDIDIVQSILQKDKFEMNNTNTDTTITFEEDIEVVKQECNHFENNDIKIPEVLQSNSIFKFGKNINIMKERSSKLVIVDLKKQNSKKLIDIIINSREDNIWRETIQKARIERGKRKDFTFSFDDNIDKFIKKKKKEDIIQVIK